MTDPYNPETAREDAPARNRRISRAHSKDLSLEDLVWCLERDQGLFSHVRAEVIKRLTRPPADHADLIAELLDLSDYYKAWTQPYHKKSHPLPYRMHFLLAEAAATLAQPVPVPEVDCHGLDTPEMVCFYEQDFYVLSNFSSFTVDWAGLTFQTSEHLYHWLKFATSPDGNSAQAQLAFEIKDAPSAHAAFKIAEMNRAYRRPDWDNVKVGFMRQILWAKVAKHEYVHRKLMATGERLLVENSWRDDYWGWGPNRDGQNMLGKLWMEVRAELRSDQHLGQQAATEGE